jgi:hypothetical protein
MKEKMTLSLFPSPGEFLKDCFVKTNPAYFAKICYSIGSDISIKSLKRKT